jgi:NAD(P)-dependent dehydrogenase (short-subunit alcohol dehydrogenase family)
MKNLQDKIVLVCGGATGIGAQTVRQLSDAGARVALGDINLEGARQTADECEGEVLAIEYDQAEEVSIKALVEQAVAHFGALNGVFANAADLQTVLIDGDILGNDAGIWERTLSVNVTGTAMIIRAALPHLLQAGGGGIVCTSSGASTIGEPERVAYAASKAGVNAICRHVASRWGKEGIRCNSIAPGLVVTEQLEEGMGQEFLDKLLKGVNATRHGEPADIAAAVTFLLSDEGAWVNGQTWHVNGGVYYGG